LEENPLSEVTAQTQSVNADLLYNPATADEALFKALENSPQTPHILGVSPRKLKSLNFRLRRRELKLRSSGTQFNKRDSLKNTNR
jgi:hypothetical protein